MRKREKINIKALMINTFAGFALSAFVSVSVFGYIFNDEASFEAEKEVSWQDAYFGFEEETTEEYAQPVFIHALTEEEIASQPETTGTAEGGGKLNITAEDLSNLKDINFLKKNFYIVDSRTDLVQSDIDAEKFINMDFSLDESTEGPKILIFHTHSSEMFADSDPSKGISEGIWGAGERLKQILEEKYNIEVLHDDGRYDVVNGKGQITGAYERMEPSIRKILADNPSIEVAIDMHRDGVNDGVRLVTEQNGKKCAKIMFFNGMCRLNKNGALESISSLPNKYITENLAFSFNMQLAANKMFPDFTRKIYVNAYRYSLHMLPKSLLIEVGAQTNTKEEVYNSMEVLAQILAEVLKAE